jgi:N-acetylmuramoyl-L-alanine amidase CwlA
MTINRLLVPTLHPNRPGTYLGTVRAIIFHYTGNDAPGADDTMNARYFGRAWTGTIDDPRERDGSPFRYGSTQIIADHDSVTVAIPDDEVAWACGDRNAGPWTPELKGQQPVAKHLFGNRQNHHSVSVEICNNDAIKDSDEDWKGACRNAASWAIDYLFRHDLTVDVARSLDPQASSEPLAPRHVLLLRHFDVTGKICPKPFVDDRAAWEKFVRLVAGVVS